MNSEEKKINIKFPFPSTEFIEKDQMFGKPGKELLLNRIIEFQQSTGRKLMVSLFQEIDFT